MRNVLITLLIVTTAFYTRAQIITPNDKQAETMLRTFYTAYMSAFSGDDQKFEQALKGLKNKYCSAKCRKQILKLADETDGDPIIKGQDSDAKWAKTLIIEKDRIRAGLFLVSYKSPLYNSKGKIIQMTTAIKLIVIRQNGNFVIDKFL